MYKISKKQKTKICAKVLEGMAQNMSIVSYEHSVEEGFTKLVFEKGNIVLSTEFVNRIFNWTYDKALENAKTEAQARAEAKAEADALSNRRRMENNIALARWKQARHEARVQRDTRPKAIAVSEALEATVEVEVNTEAYASTLKEIMCLMGIINCRHNLIDGFTQVVFAEGEQEFSARALNAMFSALYEAEAAEEQEEQSESDAFIAWALS